MRKLICCSVLLVVLCGFVGCGEPEDLTLKPKHDLKAALEAYYANKLDTFYVCVDFGTDLDTIQKQVFLASYRRDLNYTREHFGGVRAIEPKVVQFESDTVAYVLYDIVYGNQQRETSSQKMVKMGDTWKLRVRN